MGGEGKLAQDVCSRNLRVPSKSYYINKLIEIAHWKSVCTMLKQNFECGRMVGVDS